MTDQTHLAGPASGLVANPIEEATDTAGAAVGNELACDPNSRNSEIDIAEPDPVHRAARDLVKALIESRWSLHAATVVVALCRLCEAVTGKKVNTAAPTWEYIDRIANCDLS